MMMEREKIRRIIFGLVVIIILLATGLFLLNHIYKIRREVREVSQIILQYLERESGSESKKEALFKNTVDIAKEYFNRGLAYANNGNFDQAVSSFTRSIEINPNDINPWFNRGLVYFKEGNFEQAISDLNKVIEINPNYDRAYVNRGATHQKRGNLDQAVSDYNKAIEINPKEALYYYNRASVYFSKQEYNKSWADVHKVESLGARVHPGFIKKLQQASGREK